MLNEIPTIPQTAFFVQMWCSSGAGELHDPFCRRICDQDCHINEINRRTTYLQDNRKNAT